ncbi:hypothetical protein F4778DRAFT_236429 [Xylariomycetidae sp. FL2044]|nr:hypothetical protein F4778DRAFT_236429 [Xylariomycetidae sp. FL2044]
MADDFDFIVVGAGPAGCVVASRLADSPGKPSVLLIEAGGSNADTAHMSGAERFDIAFRDGSPLNWGYKTRPQGPAHHEVDYSRGKGLGGSTAINFCGWLAGADDDYDEWARLVGDESFAWKHVRECRKRIENLHDDVPGGYRKWFRPKAEDHSTGGKVDLSFQSEWLDTCHDIFLAAEQVGYEVNPDINSGNPIGMGIGSVCVYDGVRVTSSSAYLAHPPPPNLTIVVNEQVEKVIVEEGTATAIRTVNGRVFQAKKEIVVSAGALNSPQILLLSGIGPRRQLERHGISVVKDLPQVGENLMDHCYATAGLVIKKDGEGGQAFKQSPTPMGFFKIPSLPDTPEFQALPRETQIYLERPHIPHWEIAALTPFFQDAPVEPDEEIFSAMCILMNPQSRGTVTLQSADPRDAPLIDPKFLTHPFDRRAAIDAFRAMLRYMEAPTFKQRTVRTLGWPADESDEAAWAMISSTLGSSWHMCGTLRMGRDKDGEEEEDEQKAAAAACVDPSFRVFGIERLRVADMSVCPLAPNCHTQSTAYVIGEIAAEKLISDHGLTQW